MILRKLVPFCSAILLVACGTKHLGPKGQTGQPIKDTPQRQLCPGAPNPTEVLTFTFSKPVPKNLGVRFPGIDQNNFHMSECTLIPHTGVLVSLSRPNANTLVVTIDTNGAFTNNGVTLFPESQYLEIDDLGTCVSVPTPIVSAAKPVSVQWQQDFPAGISCPARILGYGSASVQNEEEMEPGL